MLKEIKILPILIIILLLIGLVAGVYLVQRQQTLKSKASAEDLYEQVGISDNEGNLKQNCTSDGNIYTCETPSDEVQIDISNLLP